MPATVPFSGADLHLTVQNAHLEVDVGTSHGTLSISSTGHHATGGDEHPVVRDGTLALADPGPSGAPADCRGYYTVYVPAGVAVDITGSNSPTTVSGLATAVTVSLSHCDTLKVDHVSGPLRLSCTGGDTELSGITATDLDSTTVTASQSADYSVDGGLYLGFDTPPTSVTASYGGGARQSLTVEVPAGTATYRIEGSVNYHSLASDPASSRIIRVSGGPMIGVFRWPNAWPSPP